MQSSDYVPGVSGWKIEKRSVEINGGPWGPICIGDLSKSSAPESDAVEPPPKPFIVVDGVTYISQAEVERASIAGSKIADMWSVKLQVGAQGQYVAAGLGLGGQEKQQTDFDKALAKGADAVFELLAQMISDTQLGAELKGCAPSSIADQVRDAIRAEIRPGGLLHRN
jgi:hypothetical protein